MPNARSRLSVLPSSPELGNIGPHTKFKASRYNVFSDRGDTVWAFNTRSTALAQLTREQYSNVQKILLTGGAAPEGGSDAALFESLVRGYYLVPEEIDEIEVLKVKNRLVRFASRGVGLVIAPTLRCNFSCEYCYVDLNANKMPPDKRARVKAFFENKMVKEGSAAICWTGGDPSLAMDVVHELSQNFIETCKKKNATYTAVMISNAYLLDEEMVEKVRESKISQIQVTLDGDRDAHNQRRYLPGKKPTYDRILENVARAADKVQIVLRINIDRYNQDTVETIFQDLSDRGLSGRVSMYFAQVEAVNEHCSPYEDRCLTTEEYVGLEPKLLQIGHRYGFDYPNSPLRSTRGEFCGANSNNYFVIDANANLLKCYNDFGTAEKNGIGYIDDSGVEVINNHQNLVKWLGWDPFEIEECRECKVLPLCMGGCSYSMIKQGDQGSLGCLTIRYTTDELVAIYADRLTQSRSGSAVSSCGVGGCSKM